MKDPKIIGIWIDAKSLGRMGQIYYGDHKHRTSDFFKGWQYLKLSAVVESCISFGWPHTYLWGRT